MLCNALKNTWVKLEMIIQTVVASSASSSSRKFLMQNFDLPSKQYLTARSLLRYTQSRGTLNTLILCCAGSDIGGNNTNYLTSVHAEKRKETYTKLRIMS
jgi:hypothetical protein